MNTILKLVPMSVFLLMNVSVHAEIDSLDINSPMARQLPSIHHGRQQTFDSPDAAVNRLVNAIRQGDQIRVRKILGEKAISDIYTKDRFLNKLSNEHFLRDYDEKHFIELSGTDKAILLIGKNEWPLPFPMVKIGSSWNFDSVAGAAEWQNRRIGSDEIAAIQVLLAYADAQREYVLQDRNSDGLLEYAQRLTSTPGLHDGLYWPTGVNEPLSPMGQAFADAHESLARRIPAETGHAYHGYYFRILTAQGNSAPGGAYSYVAKGRMIGGFAMIAYPESYASSGIKSFMISHQGIVYSKDLGNKTPLLVPKIMSYDPDQSWTKESD